MKIEQLSPSEWQRLRRIRLAALEDAPDAFGSTLSDAKSRIAADWRQQLETMVTFIAADGDVDFGIARGAPDDHDPATALLLSMWVAPSFRQRGHGERLIHAVVEWARSAGFSRVVLDVADANQPAVALYSRLGFEATGEVGSLPAPRTHVREHRRALVL